MSLKFFFAVAVAICAVHSVASAPEPWLLDNVLDLITGLITKVTGTLNDLLGVVGGLLNNVVNAVISLLTGILNGAGTVPQSIASLLGSVVTTLVQGVTDILHALVDKLNELVLKLPCGFHELINQLLGKLKEVLDILNKVLGDILTLLNVTLSLGTASVKKISNCHTKITALVETVVKSDFTANLASVKAGIEALDITTQNLTQVLQGLVAAADKLIAPTTKLASDLSAALNSAVTCLSATT